MVDATFNTANAAISQPCLSCKRRRVKCDAIKPSCARCKRDSIECPGYVRIKQWKSKYNQSQLPSETSQESKSFEVQSIGSDSVDSSSPESESDSLVPYIAEWLSIDQQALLVLDCMRYINEHQIPSRMPPQAPFNRRLFRMEYRNDMPELLQQLLVMNVRQLVVANNGNDPLGDTQVCHYRAQTLSELKVHIGNGDAVTEPYGLILSCIIMLMLGEMHNIQSGSWRYHMDAARKIITLRGGFSMCFETLPLARSLLFQYASIDMHAATTCSSIFLARMAKATAAQKDYIEFVTNEEEMAKHGYFFPSMHEDMINITLLRLSQRLGTENFIPPRDFDTILDSLEDFDAFAWANRMSVLGRELPLQPTEYPSADEMSGWFAVANAHKSAMLLYLLLSCHTGEPKWKCIFAIKHTLSRCIQFLLNIAVSDPEAPVEAQFWKFLGWPMVISTYVRIGWDVGDESIELEIARLTELAEETGRGTLLTSSGWLNMVLMRRAEDPTKQWTWDDGLDSNFYFT